MQRFELNGSGEVSPGEAFEIAATAGLASGFRLTLETPSGVTVLSSESPPPQGFGTTSKTVYRFACQSPGDYTISFKKGRPWEARQNVSQVMIRCRSV